MSDFVKLSCPCCGGRALEQEHEFYRCLSCDSIFYHYSEENRIKLVNAHSYLARYRFDDADDIYSELSEDAVETNDSKLYVTSEWGRLLSYFGIVFVKGFGGSEAVPTIVKYDKDLESVTEVEHYQNIMNSNVSEKIKNEYKLMAENIDETYKRIAPELKKDCSYDVFMCTKISSATEANPNAEGLSVDYRRANGIYDELKSRGLRVFYSDKCCQGVQYDSQIFSALVRSKLLLVLTSRKDYLESAWVESEWRRWLSFISNGDKAKNSLILFIPLSNDKVVLPSVLNKSKIQRFDDSLEVIKHIVNTLAEPKPKPEVKVEPKPEVKVEPKPEVKVEPKPEVKVEPKPKAIDYAKIYDEACKLDKAKNHTEAFKLYKEAANGGYQAAYIKLGACYLIGTGTEKNYEEAFKWYKKSAEAGEKRAFMTLASFFENSIGTKQSYIEAIKWYKRSLEAGYVQAYVALGKLYEKGHGVELNYNTAKKYYEKAIALGYEEAKNDLNRVLKELGASQNTKANSTTRLDVAEIARRAYKCYQEKNYTEAFNLYKQAAEAGEPDSMCNLGSFYSSGIGCEKNFKEGVKWFTKACDYGRPLPMRNLGIAYYYGEGVEKDYKQAISWFFRAAGAGDAQSSYYLGMCYENGYGADINYNSAKECYERAVASGYEKAKEGLNRVLQKIADKEKENNEQAYDLDAIISEATKCYQEQRYKRAFNLYSKAAGLNSPEGMLGVGLCYSKGYGVDKSVHEAFGWLKKAAEAGCTKAYRHLAKAYEDGNGTYQDSSKALQWYKKAAESGDSVAATYLGDFYAADYDVAKKYYELAYKLGNKTALGKISKLGNKYKKLKKSR